VDVLRNIARRCGIEEEAVINCVKHTEDGDADTGTQQWVMNHEEAKSLGEC
jgi:hypothetical protein